MTLAVVRVGAVLHYRNAVGSDLAWCAYHQGVTKYIVHTAMGKVSSLAKHHGRWGRGQQQRFQSHPG